MKREIRNWLRSTGLLAVSDRLVLPTRRIATRGRNRRFRLANPDYAYPPEDLAFDAYGHLDIAGYHRSGVTHARLYAQLIRDCFPPGPLSILDWGCGPARIIRHMRQCLEGYPLTLTGSDWNPRSIAWSGAQFPGIDFVANGFLPPLPFDAGSFDVVYNFSVLTHLSEAVQRAWLVELERVLKPGGLLICSTQGDDHCRRLAGREEAERYRRGEMVVQAGYAEGRKWFLALHPPRYVETRLLAGFTDIRHVPPGPDPDLRHDIWTARKAAATSSAGLVAGSGILESL
jgi:SAM-dependent methyltransferase